MNRTKEIDLFPVLKTLMQVKVLNILFKFILILLLGWVIYNQVFAKENIEELYQAFLSRWTIEMIPWLVLSACLMPLNWFFETLKWRQLINRFDNNSIWQHYKAILAGVSFSIFTPNRIGEYGGRILMVAPENNWKAVVATLVGSLSQLLVLLTMGILGFVYFISQFLQLEVHIFGGMLFLSLILTAGLFLFFYNIDLAIPIVRRMAFTPRLKRWAIHFKVLKKYETRDLNRALFFAFLRYLVYTAQYLLLLKFFGVEVPVLMGMAGVATIFLLQTSIPVPPLMGLLVRGELALYIWGSFCTYELNILAATFSLWVLNLIIPSLVGMVFIVNINVLKSLGYDKKGD